MQKQIALSNIRDFKRPFRKHEQGRTRCDLDSLGTNESRRRGILQRLPLRPTWADTGQRTRLFCGHGEEKIKTKTLESWAEALRPAVRDTNWFCCLRWKTERPVCWIHGCSCRWLTAEGGKTELRLEAGGRAEGEGGWMGLSVGQEGARWGWASVSGVEEARMRFWVNVSISVNSNCSQELVPEYFGDDWTLFFQKNLSWTTTDSAAVYCERIIVNATISNDLVSHST